MYELGDGDNALQTVNDTQDYFGTDASAAGGPADYSNQYDAGQGSI